LNKNFFKIILLSSAIFILVWLVIYSANWEKKEQEIGLSKEAYSEPLLAAKFLLDTNQISLTTLKNKTDFLEQEQVTLSRNSTLILDEAALNEHPKLESALADWVYAGGHLVYTLSPRRDLLELDDNELLLPTELEVIESEEMTWRYDILNEPSPNLLLQWNEDKLKLNLPFRAFFEGCGGTEYHTLDDDKVLLCEQAVGKGYITYIPSIFAISNSGLKHLDHGAFLLWLAGDRDHLFYLPSLSAPNWLFELWRWSWSLVVLFCISAACIIWHLFMRFGSAKYPLFELKSPFADHIEAIGGFMVNQGHYDALKSALLKDLEHKIEKRNPRFKSLAIEQQIEIISQLTGKESKVIEALLTRPMPEQQDVRLRYIKLFKELRKAL